MFWILHGRISAKIHPCSRELDFGVEDLKISKKALAVFLEYLSTTQIREGFILDSNLNVVGCFEFYTRRQQKSQLDLSECVSQIGSKLGGAEHPIREDHLDRVPPVTILLKPTKNTVAPSDQWFASIPLRRSASSSTLREDRMICSRGEWTRISVSSGWWWSSRNYWMAEIGGAIFPKLF